jgi:hypothetical protein
LASVDAIGSMKSEDGLRQALSSSDEQVREAAEEKSKTSTRWEGKGGAKSSQAAAAAWFDVSG